MPKIFIISKPIKFDRKNIPIPGQTDPETDGWNLILLDTGNHSEEIVFSGFYRHCKDLQQLYTNKPSGDFSGEIAGMQKEAESIRAGTSSIFRRAMLRRKKNRPPQST